MDGYLEMSSLSCSAISQSGLRTTCIRSPRCDDIAHSWPCATPALSRFLGLGSRNLHFEPVSQEIVVYNNT